MPNQSFPLHHPESIPPKNPRFLSPVSAEEHSKYGMCNDFFEAKYKQGCLSAMQSLRVTKDVEKSKK